MCYTSGIGKRKGSTEGGCPRFLVPSGLRAASEQERAKARDKWKKHKKTTPLISLDIVVENTPSHNFRLRKQQYPKQEKRKPYAHQKIPCLSQAIPVTLLTDLL